MYGAMVEIGESVSSGPQLQQQGGNVVHKIMLGKVVSVIVKLLKKPYRLACRAGCKCACGSKMDVVSS